MANLAIGRSSDNKTRMFHSSRMTTDQILEALHQLSSDDLKKIFDTAQALYQLERKRFKEQRSQLLAKQALLVLEDYSV